MSSRTKQGAASIFVVIFTTLLLGVITLSFVRIMLSEANQTTNYDLAQSAYDSALAGIEDAKVALLKYHQCLNQGATTTSNPTNIPNCSEAIRAMVAKDAKEDCDIISVMLSRPYVEGQETIIQSEDRLDPSGEATNSMEQAYTCVKISEVNDDYLGRLNNNYRTKIIPIRTEAGKLNSWNRVRIEWYSTEDKAQNTSGYNGMGSGTINTNKYGYNHDSEFSDTNIFAPSPMIPPTIQMQLIQTDDTFTLSQFDKNSGDRTNQGTITLRPSNTGGVPNNLVTNSTHNGIASAADKSINNPMDIRCYDGRSYACTADIVVPKPVQTGGVDGTLRDDATSFLRLVLPYANPETSFSVKLYYCANETTTNINDCTVIDFVGVQAKVDSTGRANDLFRRVEARVELVDTYFPYPEFTADLNGGGGDSIWKNYWITKNCWKTGGGAGAGQNCVNSGKVTAGY